MDVIHLFHTVAMDTLFQTFLTWFLTQLNVWVAIGLFGQTLFMLRFVFQWVHSERAKKSVMPEIFWYLSLGGGLIVLTYAIHQKDLVFILSQSAGSIIYLRNIQLIWRHKRLAKAA
jgi:lipid-A-disaccharide synthase-like uncharacterized protein